MSIPLAFIGVIIIWSTTPLAIQWSGDYVGFYFGLMARMVLGAVVILAIAQLFRQRVPFHKAARRVYLATTIHLFASMVAVYWGAQYINTGLLSVLFGTAPLATGLFAAWLLNERVFTAPKITGVLLGLTGLAVIFSDSLHQPDGYLTGVVLVVVAAVLYGLAAVLVRKFTQALDEPLPAFAINAGGIWFSLPFFVLGSLFFVPEFKAIDWQQIPDKAIFSITYLGVIGSVLGFVLYFYLIKHVEASKISLITLITPVTALMLGNWFNNETISSTVLIGTALTLLGLASFQWGERCYTWLSLQAFNKRLTPEQAACEERD